MSTNTVYSYQYQVSLTTSILRTPKTLSWITFNSFTVKKLECGWYVLPDKHCTLKVLIRWGGGYALATMKEGCRKVRHRSPIWNSVASRYYLALAGLDIDLPVRSYLPFLRAGGRFCARLPLYSRLPLPLYCAVGMRIRVHALWGSPLYIVGSVSATVMRALKWHAGTCRCRCRCERFEFSTVTWSGVDDADPDVETPIQKGLQVQWEIRSLSNFITWIQHFLCCQNFLACFQHLLACLQTSNFKTLVSDFFTWRLSICN